MGFSFNIYYMPINYAAKYNPSKTQITGCTQVGNIAVSTDMSITNLSGFSGGIDDTNGYVIISDTVNAGLVGRSTANHVGVVSSTPSVPTYWRSPLRSSDSFINLSNRLPLRKYQTPFSTGSEAKTWLNNNGYFTDFNPSELLALYNASNSSSYPGYGSTWFDISNHSPVHDGTIVNATFDGEILIFYFNTAYISIGQPIPTGSSYTINAWIYPFDVNGARNIVSSESSPFWINSGTLWAGVGNSYFLVGESGITDHIWYFVSVTFNDSTNTMSLYINGVQVDQNTNVTQTYTAQNTFIGSHYTGSTNASFFDGHIGYVDIHGGALTSGEILNIYNQTQRPEYIN
jgi:prepilin-type processing-associated H-X9-DG protein